MDGAFTREGTGEKWAVQPRARTGGLWRDCLDLTKPGITISNLLACAAGFWTAGGAVSGAGLFLAVMGGTALVIGGSCALNNWIDRDIDPLMERTRDRSLPAGRVAPAVAWFLGLGLVFTGEWILWRFVNEWGAGLAAAGAFLYIVIYSLWLKRVSVWNTVVGSLSGAVPPLIGWVAATGSPGAGGWLLFLLLFLWQPAHFFALAMWKAEDYRRAGIPMLPVVKGNRAAKLQILLFVALLLPASMALDAAGTVGGAYPIVALLLGGVYLALAVAGFFTGAEDRWSRRMFRYSLVYLTGMLVACAIFAHSGG